MFCIYTDIFKLYTNEELGVIYSKKSSIFKIWAPTAQRVSLNLYMKGSGSNLIKKIEMGKSSLGVWTVTVSENLHELYYTYDVTINGETNEVVDIYAKAVGVNGKRGMVIDLEKTNPEGWNEASRPEFKAITDAVLYEAHVRDFSIDESSGIKHKGIFLGFTELGTKNPSGHFTGLSHLKELGVTHVHLLPAFDYETVDEENLNQPQFNWGYDPQNYNTPEGSYSTNPNDGAVRIKEFKELIKALHDNGIRVVMDVVYNHTYKATDSSFNLTVPDYYYRTENGKFTDGSACGNETASEHPMMRKFLIDSVKYWAEEYKIDGFRFDLMGLHDVDTMNEIRNMLKGIDESLIVYGEGWCGGDTPLPVEKRSLKANADKLTEIAFFSDDMRDVIKGSVFEYKEKGFVSGEKGLEEKLKLCITASTKNKLIEYSKLKGLKAWSTSPTQTVNYTEAHDNYTLWDKLYYSSITDSAENRIKMDMLAASIVFLSQGIPFIQAGQEFLRTKPKDETGEIFVENSYNSPDFVNSIKWNRKSEYIEVFNFYKGMIELRKNHSLFRLKTVEEIEKCLSFFGNTPENVVAFTLKNSDEEIVVIFNASISEIELEIPDGTWGVYVNDKLAGNKAIAEISSGNIKASPISPLVLIKQ